MQRMFSAECLTYVDYQHSHNPPTEEDALDYSFDGGSRAFCLLVGCGKRDIERDSYQILGRAQFDRFNQWADALTHE